MNSLVKVAERLGRRADEAGSPEPEPSDAADIASTALGVWREVIPPDYEEETGEVEMTHARTMQVYRAFCRGYYGG